MPTCFDFDRISLFLSVHKIYSFEIWSHTGTAKGQVRHYYVTWTFILNTVAGSYFQLCILSYIRIRETREKLSLITARGRCFTGLLRFHWVNLVEGMAQHNVLICQLCNKRLLLSHSFIFGHSAILMEISNGRVIHDKFLEWWAECHGAVVLVAKTHTHTPTKLSWDILHSI